jgi:hypothetical protein
MVNQRPVSDNTTSNSNTSQLNIQRCKVLQLSNFWRNVARQVVEGHITRGGNNRKIKLNTRIENSHNVEIIIFITGNIYNTYIVCMLLRFPNSADKGPSRWL